MPRISVLMPTYNRAGEIVRAIRSVQAQTFTDWELVVVDDGSTDGTADQIAGMDPRMRIIRQENRGLAGARNRLFQAAEGELIAFLDSDDEWLPHHLELAAAFFQAFPGEQVFAGEFWEDFGDKHYVKHFQVETGSWGPRIARRIGSSAFLGPSAASDPYLSVYETRAPAGDWARRALGPTPYAEAWHYRGNIFHGWRWEWLMAMQSTVITRRVLEEVGLMDERFPACCDFGWLARVSRKFPVNTITAPSCIKHEYGPNGERLTEGHIVTGKLAVRFHAEMLQLFEELFLSERPDDPELQGIRGYRKLKVAEAALLKGQRKLALEHLRDAARTYPGADTSALLWLSRLAPGDAAARALYAAALRARHVGTRAWELPGRILARLAA